MKKVVILPLLLLAAETSLGQWGPRGCAAGPVGPTFASTTYEWVILPAHPGQAHLMQGGQQLGTFRYDDGLYYPYDGRRWTATGTNSPAGAPPIPGVVGTPAKKMPAKEPGKCGCTKDCRCDVGCPACKIGYLCSKGCTCARETGAAEQIVAPRPDYGMHWTPDAGGRERYLLNGVEVPRNRGVESIQKGIPDDRGKWRLTVIGPEAERKRVVEDLGRPPLAEFRDKLLVQTYAPDHWTVRDAGFVCQGKPTIYLQAADGQVLHRQDDYADGPEGLAGAIRKADPNYRPERDRDLRKPQPSPLPIPLPGLPGWVKQYWELLLVGSIVLAVWLLTPRRSVA